MPCSDSRDYRGPLPEELRRQQITTQLACEYCRLLEKAGKPIPDYAQEFWEDHKRQDAKREAQETQDRERLRVRSEGLAKLTQAERIALGIR